MPILLSSFLVRYVTVSLHIVFLEIRLTTLYLFPYYRRIARTCTNVIGLEEAIDFSYSPHVHRYSKKAKALLQSYDLDPQPKVVEVDLRGQSCG